ncbi:MAG TPA: serine/threonine-protein kinase [Planctomycetota bacterium]|nr:serine/threonine-protein kinase [Planctomycetota bacterium]
MLSGDDIQLLLEARRLGYLTAQDASRCLQVLVDAERSGAAVDVAAVIGKTTTLSASALAQLRKAAHAPKKVKKPASEKSRRRPGAQASHEEVQLLLEARRLGYLSATEVDRCLLLLVEAARKNAKVDLRHLLVSKNLLTATQLDRIRTRSGRLLVQSPSGLSETLHVPLPGEWLGDYRILRQIGRGTTGVLYEAARRGAGHGTLALKVFAPPKPGTKVLKRFRREAGLAAALDHPNIVKIHEVGRDRGFEFIVMDFFRGRSLAHFLRTTGISPRKAVEIIAVCARAAHYMHEKGVVHRDLKPGNIMVGKKGVCIVDFGLAKDAARSGVGLTMTSELLGTPAYMAPEQARGDISAIGPWTDVFALGATLYRAIAGEYHFEARNLFEAITAVASGSWPFLKAKRKDVPGELSQTIARAMAPEPQDRPSAIDLARRLQRVLATNTLSIPPAAPSDEA